MAIAYVKEVTHATPSVTGTTFALTVTNAPGAGNLLILSACNATAAITGVTDSKGNTWTVDKVSSASAPTAICSTVQNAGALQAGDTITITFGSALSSGKCAFVVHEFSGCTNTVDVSALNNIGVATTARQADGAPPTTTNANDLVWAAFGVNAIETSFTPGAGYSTPTEGAFYANATNNSIEFEYQILSATGPVDPTGTGGVSGKYDGMVVVYKATAGGGGLASPISQHGPTPVSAHTGVGGSVEVTQHAGNSGTPIGAHSGVPGYTAVEQH